MPAATRQSAAWAAFNAGMVIPAHPLALDARRRLDERRQRAMSRYYLAAGAGGLAVGVHTTQFAIRDPAVGLLEPVLRIAREEMDRADATRPCPLMRIGGVCGRTDQAVREAETLRDLGYHAGLLSFRDLGGDGEASLLEHARQVGGVIPLVGFYLQPAVGGRVLSGGFWRRFAELESVRAIKIAPFSRYGTLEVVRAVVEAGRDDIALYTGNDDNVLADLLTPFTFRRRGRTVTRRIVGGLLGHWAVWTRRAVEQLHRCREVARTGGPVPMDLLRLNAEVTDANAAIFDAANGFAGVIAGVHEVLRRQGLLAGTWCLDPEEHLGPGQREQIDRVYAAYPHLNDDDFVAAGRDAWLSG